MTLNQLMQSNAYTSLLDQLDKHIPNKIDRASKVHEAIIGLTEKWMQHASLSCEDLLRVISKYPEHLAAYIIKKQATFAEPDGGRDNIINHPPKINFPLGHAIEYYLLSERANQLPEYIKNIRIPSPRHYTKQIKKIFDDISPP
ncbi:hypothetical protein JET66_19015 [Pseudomonas putida]|uniref:hypothetical protein n=1 Tax=Pseudomonas putida TaxID=303 RepID=UPI0018E68FF6|nr:hypothetical protein [Pseudomonas putida]MBI6926734.1 hypothetical protein [Pseudomonas putida]